ncbi:MAG: hypothetical protein IPK22_01855 [Verrucomicrobiaceae bacterium]|nr:hypothetical protein [Verrucomicrobiaceae bacterium]
MKTQSTHAHLHLTKSFRPLATLLLGTSIALTGTGSSSAADAEGKANARLFTQMTATAKTAPKVARITYTATLLSAKMRLALVSDGANVVCFLTDGNSSKPNTISLEGSLVKGELSMVSNPLGHEQAGSRATLVGRMTTTDFSGTLTLSGVRHAVSGRAAAVKSPAGLYHLYSGGLDIAVAVDEAGGSTAIAKRIKTGEALPAKAVSLVLAGALPRIVVYGPTGGVLTTVDVRRVRGPILGLLHLWSDDFKSAVKPAVVPWVTADLLGNAIRPFDVAVLPSPEDDPSLLLFSEQVERRIVLWAPPSNATDGSILTVADSGDWRDTRTTGAGQPRYLAVFENSLAVNTITDPGYDASLNQIPQRGQLNRLVSPDALYLQNNWSMHADHVGNLVKNPNNDGVSFGFTWTQKEIYRGPRQPITPRHLIRTSAQGVHRVLSDNLDDFSSDVSSNAIGQIGTFPQSFMVPVKKNESPFSQAHLVTDNSTSVTQERLAPRDSSGQSLIGAPSNMTLDGMDLKGFRVVDGARMENDAIFLLTRHLNYWKQEGQTVGDGAGGVTYVGEYPRYREVAFGPLNYEQADSWMINQFTSTEPAMWALVRVNAQGVASLYHKGNEPIFATGLDIESTPEGKHVLVADHGPAGFGGQIIRVAPSETALAAYMQRIQDNFGQ